MSTMIIYAAEVVRRGSSVVFRVASRDSNCFPAPGKNYGKGEGDFSDYAPVPEGDIAGLVEKVESLARGYDGRCITERGKFYNGPAAYKLWATRIKRGTGVVIPKLANSAVFYDGMPPDISGKKTFQFSPVPKGATLTIAQAAALIEGGVRFEAMCKSPFNPEPFRVRLGFVSGGELYYYRRGSHKYGRSVPRDSTFTTLAALAPEACAFGAMIPAISDMKTVDEVIASRREDVFVLISSDERLVSGEAPYHELISIARMGIFDKVPSVYGRADAEKMLARLNQFASNLQWSIESLLGLAQRRAAHDISALNA